MGSYSARLIVEYTDMRALAPEVQEQKVLHACSSFPRLYTWLHILSFLPRVPTDWKPWEMKMVMEKS